MERSVRRLLGSAIVTAVVFSASPLHAQNSMSFGVMGGIGMPMSDTKDDAGMGWHVGGVADWTNSLSPLGVRFNVVYDHFGVSDVKWLNVGFQTAVHGLSALSGSADVMWRLTPAQTTGMGTHLLGGLGVYQLKLCSQYTTNGTTASCETQGYDSQTHAGANVGAGLTFPMSQLNVGVDGTYHYVFGDASGGSGHSQFIRLSLVVGMK